jgi:MATE family multidrug resistance protein
VWLGFGWGLDAPWGIYGFWTGMTAGLSTVALLLGWRLWRVSRDARRIEALAAG